MVFLIVFRVPFNLKLNFLFIVAAFVFNAICRTYRNVNSLACDLYLKLFIVFYRVGESAKLFNKFRVGVGFLYVSIFCFHGVILGFLSVDV